MTANVITVTSGKGGVGKTTVTVNLAVSLALRGRKVVCIDGDIGLRNMDVILGLENRIVYDLVDAAEGRCRLKQAMIHDKRLSDLYLIPASQTRDKDAVTPEQMIQICNDLRDEFDYIIIDSPAGIEQGFKNAVAPADRILIVTNPEVSAVRDADRIIGLIEAEGKGPGELVLNRINKTMVERGDMMNQDDVNELLAIDLIGLIPEDENVIVSTNRGNPIAFDEKTAAGKAFRNLAARVEGESVPFDELDVKDSFMSRLKKIFG